MIADVREWLPREAIAADAIHAALHDVLAEWSACWLARRTADISDVRIGEGSPLPTPAQSLQVQGAHVMVDMPARGKRHLLEALLDVDLASQVLVDGDRHLLDVLATDAVEDLVARLDNTFGREAPCSGGARIGLSLLIGQNEFLTVSVAEHVLVPILKARLGRGKTFSDRPRARGTALKKSRVVAEAKLGRIELALSDLGTLSVGDVLIMDRALNDPVDLHLPGHDRPVAHGRLCRSGGHMSIQL